MALFQRRFDGIVSATVHGIMDRFKDGAPPLALGEDDRLDGRTCLVTGANRGLGLAISTELARRGAHLILACRSGIPEAMETVRRAAGPTGSVEASSLDLGDLASVERLVTELAEDGVRIDVLVLNAAIVPDKARPSRHGVDEMFQVNYLANFLLVNRLLARGVITAGEEHDADDGPKERRIPRVVMVSSESYRTTHAIEWSTFGQPGRYGMRQVVEEYGHTKLLLETFAAELARRHPELAVHTSCPGAVATDIAREAPGWVKPLLDPAIRRFFKPPAEGATPLVYLSASKKIEGRTGMYLHVKTEKARDPRAEDPRTGKRLWDASESLLTRLGFPISA